ncbi:MAG: nicotinate phosphoribosyltransferase [Saccharofermentanales bacterium]|jgi:nicotinate phosphoribosyltransferase|nr:nicotinate phosphoribosyltransferase [Bacillota bacterium]
MKNHNWNLRTNMTMLTDLYELTMMNGYLQNEMKDRRACFDLFFRSVPESGGYAIMAGVQQMIDYLSDLKFEDEDIDYLESLQIFEPDFIEYLENFEFACDVWAIPEGTPIFPGEPIVKVIGPIMQAQMIETMLLVTINHQSLIATKSSRIVRSAGDRPVMEFGARRAQGYDASVLGARAAYIAGVAGTSCTIAAQHFSIPALGTMAHSWVQSFPSEYEAFKAYALTYPDNTQFLVDTYNTLHSGIPNSIKVAEEVLHPIGKRLKAIRIDSGDLTYLTIQAREMLDQAGLTDCKITVSNAMDEYLIRDLLLQGAKIDNFGVGERLITSRAEPVFGGVYKLSAIEYDDEMVPRMKISDNPEKITNPGVKELWRFYDRDTGFALADLITLEDEQIDDTKPLEIFDPHHTWKRKVLTNFRAEKMLKPVFVQGKQVYENKPLSEIREYCADQLAHLWNSIKRFENPQTYYVDLSQDLWDLRQSFLAEY